MNIKTELENLFINFNPKKDNWATFSGELAICLNKYFPIIIEKEIAYQALTMRREKNGLNFIKSLIGVLAMNNHVKEAKVVAFKVAPFFPELFVESNVPTKLVS